MKLRQLSGAAALALAATLALSACSDSPKDTPNTQSQSSSAEQTPAAEITATTEADAKLLEGITYTTEAGKGPSDIKIASDLSTLSAFAAAVSVEGSGDALATGDTLEVNYVVTDDKGEVLESTYENGAATSLANSADQTVPQIVKALEGHKVGAFVTYAIPGNPATETTEATTANVMILEITGKVPNRAWGEDQEVTVEGAPTVALDESGKPSITIPEGYEGTDELQVIVLKKGDGKVLAETDTITAHYTGWNLKGQQFDSSWDRGAPTSFPLTGVIEGWTKGLSGQTVGSQVLLVIPAEQGYGEWAEGDADNAAKGDLIFVVDILS